MATVIGTELIPAESSFNYAPDVEKRRISQFLSTAGLRVKDDVEGKLTYGDVIELYDSDRTQVYCNGKFFEVTSVAIDELHTRPFDELYKRSADILAPMLEAWQKVFSDANKGKAIDLSSIPPHTLIEAGGEGLAIDVIFKWAWPVFNSEDKVVGLLVSQKATRSKSPRLRPMN